MFTMRIDYGQGTTESPVFATYSGAFRALASELTVAIDSGATIARMTATDHWCHVLVAHEGRLITYVIEGN